MEGGVRGDKETSGVHLVTMATFFFAVGIPLSVLNFVASARNVNCYVQGRVFEEDGVTPAGSTFISLRQNALIDGNEVLVQFGTDTNSLQTISSGVASNALCLPVACDDFPGLGVTMQAEEGVQGGMRLLPERFPDGIFDDGNEPLVLSTVFIFMQLPLAQPGITAPPTLQLRGGSA